MVSAQCRSDSSMHDGLAARRRLDEREEGAHALLPHAGRVDLARRLVAHEGDQAVRDAHDLGIGARSAEHGRDPFGGRGSGRRQAGVRAPADRPGAAPRRPATTGWPRHRARTGPAARPRRGHTAAQSPISSASRVLPRPGSPSSSASWARPWRDRAVDRVTEHRRARGRGRRAARRPGGAGGRAAGSPRRRPRPSTGSSRPFAWIRPTRLVAR